ncbi:MAG: type VI secretion lipoprotein TssJ [Gammaproteobacteria bacterium]|nr:type VI secretion lipoprotein TssJ [Gammaproteobacteria bacterium]
MTRQVWRNLKLCFVTVLLLPLGLQGCIPEPATKGVIDETPFGPVAQQPLTLYRPEPVKDSLPQTLWVYEEKAITLRLTAAELMNYYDGQPHTLYVGLFQIKSPADFKKIALTKTGMQELLSSQGGPESGDAAASVLYSERLLLQPATDKVVVLDRVDQARYLAIIAGYADLNDKKTVRIIPFQGMQEPRTNLIDLMGDPVIRTAIMKIWVNFGQEGVEDIYVRTE